MNSPLTGPTHPITLFTSVSLLSSIAFSLFRLCLKKQPDKSTSYQVSSATHTSLRYVSAQDAILLNERVGFFFSLFQMSDQPAEGTFTDADRSTVTSTTASSVQYHILTYEPDSSPLKHILQDHFSTFACFNQRVCLQQQIRAILKLIKPTAVCVIKHQCYDMNLTALLKS